MAQTDKTPVTPATLRRNPAAMDPASRKAPQRRNRPSERRRRDIIEGAVRFLAQHGDAALSIAALASDLGMNRAIIYYHFSGREALLDAIVDWSCEQLSATYTPLTGEAMTDQALPDLVLNNTGLLRLWTDRLIGSDDIRQSYPDWAELVSGLALRMKSAFPDRQLDAEVLAMILLLGTILGPRAFRSVDPESPFGVITERFRQELNRLIGRTVSTESGPPE